MSNIYLLLFLVTIPLLLALLSSKVKLVRSVGPVLIAYVLGLAFSIIDFNSEMSVVIKENVAYASAMLALPLLIISNSISDIVKQLGKSIFVGLLGFISLTIVIVISYYLYVDRIHDLWKVSGILFGLYTGGTPNMVAIQTALKLDANLFLTLTISDMIATGVFLIFAILLMKIINKKSPEINIVKTPNETIDSSNFNYIKLLIIAIVIVAISYAISLFVFPNYVTVSIIIFITSISILLPFIIKSYNKTQAYNLGNIFIIIFSFGISSMMDVEMLNFDSLWIPVYVLTVLLSTFILHLLLSKIFKISTNFVIVVAVSLICSPAFVPLIIGYSKDKSLLVPGVSIGILGYIVGNYLGISVAFLLK